jgi:predicted deacylase
MPPAIRITEFSWLFAPAEGLWYPAVEVGETVRKDQTLGRVASIFGDDIASVTAPHAGDVLFLTTSPAMREGGVLLAIGGH